MKAKYLRRIILPTVILLVGTSASLADFTTNQVAQSRVAATNSLSEFKSLITIFNYKLMGFNSTNDAAVSVVGKLPEGEPFKIYRIPSERLTNYTPSIEITNLIEFAGTILYPIVVGSKVTSSLTLRSDSNGWTTSSWGQPDRVRRLTALREALRRQITNARQPLPSEMFAVDVPVLGLPLIGFYDRRGNVDLFSDINVRSRAPFPDGFPVSKSDLAWLGVMAKRYSAGQSN